MNNWISVLDELPEIGKPVLVWYIIFKEVQEPKIATRQDRMSGEDSWLTAYWCDKDGRDAFAHVYNEDGTINNQKVSHWQYLPKGPTQ